MTDTLTGTSDEGVTASVALGRASGQGFTRLPRRFRRISNGQAIR